MTNVYDWADRCIDQSPTYATGFTQLLASNPYIVSSVVRSLYESRASLIRVFQQTSLDIFRAALKKKTDPTILNWLLNDTPESLGIRYHCNLEDRHFTLPMFFRTDEVMHGMIAEIQCPGSLWGELQLAFDYLVQIGRHGGLVSPAEQFASQLTSQLDKVPNVHHLLDNASAPACMRYFIEKTRPAVQYWGIDRSIRAKDCNFIRSHSFFGLCADNEFISRMEEVGKGVTYDLPPHVLFDQKASLVLPFWSLTRDSFSNEIRDLFCFTVPLLPSGIELPDKTHVTIEDFAKLSRSKRSYYLKYAGSDVSLNWGSKAIYRLSNMSSNDCLILLKRCIAEFDKGKIWLIQKEETHDDNITFLHRDGGELTKKLRAKFSAFYGPSGCIGVIAMHRSHNKVHGQAETVISYILGDGTNDEAVLG